MLSVTTVPFLPGDKVQYLSRPTVVYPGLHFSLDCGCDDWWCRWVNIFLYLCPMFCLGSISTR